MNAEVKKVLNTKEEILTKEEKPEYNFFTGLTKLSKVSDLVTKGFKSQVSENCVDINAEVCADEVATKCKEVPSGCEILFA